METRSDGDLCGAGRSHGAGGAEEKARAGLEPLLRERRRVLVVDEWESEEGFHAFFAEATEIPGMMAEAGVTSESEITFWRKLETHDDYPAA